jgi:hypothetical protein
VSKISAGQIHLGKGGWQDQALSNDEDGACAWFAENIFEELDSANEWWVLLG